MDILFITPQPYFTDRGTPIDVDLAVRVLSERGERVDIVTYHLGRDIPRPGVTIYRIAKIPFIREIGAGFSWQKVLCDLFLLHKTFTLVLRNRYQVVHAVEEAVFIALLLKVVFRLPYIYDMDSSLSQQMIERYPRLFKPVSFLLKFFERIAVQNAKAVVPVCDALSVDIQKYKPAKVAVIHDITLLEDSKGAGEDNLRLQLGIEGILVMYVGNLEIYQGVDLLLESFALVQKETQRVDLVIIGGKGTDIQKYQALTKNLGIHEKVHFVGSKPIELLAGYLAQADILVSPRILGTNTPMKIYSYLHSGKALLATDRLTHTQVLDSSVAYLAEAEPEPFAAGMLQLICDESLRERLGTAAVKLVNERHTYPVLQNSYNGLYDWVGAEVA